MIKHFSAKTRFWTKNFVARRHKIPRRRDSRIYSCILVSEDTLDRADALLDDTLCVVERG